MKKLFLFLGMLLMMVSCDKDNCDCDPSTPTVSLTSANVSIKIIDNQQQSFEGGNVRLYSSIPSDEMIYNGLTDASGLCNIGKVIEGQYNYWVSAQQENRIYMNSEFFQVIAGNDKVIEVNPFSNVGSVAVRVLGLQSEPISNINVALIPHPNYSNEEYYFDDLLSEAYFIGLTNQEGIAEFSDVPAGGRYSMVYSIMCFYNMDQWTYPVVNNSFYMTFNDHITETISINL